MEKVGAIKHSLVFVLVSLIAWACSRGAETTPQNNNTDKGDGSATKATKNSGGVMNQQENGRSKALFEAAGRGETSAVQKLIRQGVDVNSRDEEERQQTALFYAATNGKNDPSTVIALLKASADVNARDLSGSTALLTAIDPGGTPANIKALIDGGADVNVQDLGGDTPLMRASGWNATSIVKMLLDAGADPNLKQREGRTALMIAAKLAHAGAVQLLLDRGADVAAKDNQGRTALDLAQETYKKDDMVSNVNDFEKRSRARIIKLLKESKAK